MQTLPFPGDTRGRALDHARLSATRPARVGDIRQRTDAQ
ncbi:hypothetical protein FHR56_002775 [Xanthomonas sacchari]|nr:hypothetical protein [Xanthomonas sp. F10]